MNINTPAQYEGGQADARMALEGSERPSVFRPKYRKLDDDELMRMNAVKASAQELWDLMDDAMNHRFGTPENTGAAVSPAACREHSLARTKLEEAVMWAVKGLTG